ncbi:Odorant receptor 68 [Blattella germanica]|nr:Odorant receptor 68 [Blattella germanica]
MDLVSPKMIKFLGIEPERGAKEFLNFNLQRLRYLGIWRWDVPHFKLNQAFACVQIIAIFLFSVTEILSAFDNLNDLDHLTKLCITTVFVYLLIFKNIYLAMRMDYACELIDMLENKFFTSSRPPTQEQLMIVNRYGARAKFFTILRSNMALSIITFWLCAPLKDMLTEFTSDISFNEDYHSEEVESVVNKTSERQLPFVATFPFDIQNSLFNYIIGYVFQVFCGFTVFIGMPAWDMMFVSIFIHTSGHFKALQHVLFNLQRNLSQTKMRQDYYSQAVQSSLLAEEQDQCNTNTEALDTSSMQVIIANQDLDDNMLETLNNCIQHHQLILNFVEKLEGLLGPVMLMQMMASVIAFCVIGFQMSVIPISTESVKFVKLSVSLVSALVEQGMFYWFGGELLEESAQTLNAAYHCEWYSTDMKFRQNLRLMMERAKRPVKLTAGGFSLLTLESFASVVQSSYSYFTMLKAVHDEDQE